MKAISARPAFVVTGVLALLLIAVLVVRPQTPRDGAPADGPAACDVNKGACVLALDTTRQVQVSMTPRPVAVMKPTAISIRPQGFAAPPLAHVDFNGADMEMGFNRAALHRDPDGVLRGSALLPVCVTGTMRWRAELSIDAGGKDPARIAWQFLAPLPGER